MHPLVAAILSGCGGGARITISNVTLSGSGNDPGTASCDYRLESDGDIGTKESPEVSFTDAGDWVSPKSAAGSTFSAKMTKQSGSASLSTGSEATWQSLSSTRTYGISQTGVGTATYVGKLEISSDGGTTTAASATIDLTANVSIGP